MSQGRQIAQMERFILQEAHEKCDEILQKAQEEYDRFISDARLQSRQEIDQERKELLKNLESEKKSITSTAQRDNSKQKMEHREELLAQMFAAAKAHVSAVTSDTPTYKALVTKLLVQAMLRLDEPEVHIQCRAEDASLVTSCIADAKAQFEAKAAALETASSKTCTLELSAVALEGSLGGVLCSAMGKPPRSKIKCDNTLDARLGLVYEELKPQIRASLFPSSIREVIVHEAYDSDDEGEPGPDDDM